MLTRLCLAFALALTVIRGSLADGVTRTWDIDGVSREAILHYPAGSDREKPVKSPVILAFHGHGGRAARVEKSMDFQSHWPEALVIYPQGLKTKSARDPEGARSGWQNRVGMEGDRDVKFIDRVIESLRNEGWVDDARVFATGHSNGGGFTYALWNARPGMLAAAAPVAAGSFDVLKLTPLACMHVAARGDAIVPFANQQRTMVAVRRINGCEEEGTPWAKDCTRWSSTKGAPFVGMVIDGGHDYPREAPPLIVRFFKEQAPRVRAPDAGPRGNGPWDNDIGVFRVDGRSGEVTRVHTFPRAGVSTVVRLENGDLLAAFQWFPDALDRKESFDRIATSRSTDGGKTWSEPRTAEFKGVTNNERPPFDPTLVALEDGRVRMYVTRAARAGAGRAIPRIGSAISRDGVRFELEEGPRLEVDGEPVIDCAVARIGPTWHLFAPIQKSPGAGYHAISEDGVKFTRVADVTRDASERWLGAVVAVDGALHFYGTSDRGIWCARSADGKTWSEPAPGHAAAPKVAGADPGVAFLASGDAIVTATVMKPKR